MVGELAGAMRGWRLLRQAARVLVLVLDQRRDLPVLTWTVSPGANAHRDAHESRVRLSVSPRSPAIPGAHLAVDRVGIQRARRRWRPVEVTRAIAGATIAGYRADGSSCVLSTSARPVTSSTRRSMGPTLVSGKVQSAAWARWSMRTTAARPVELARAKPVIPPPRRPSPP
jgi:hypothetical protein